MIFDDKMMACLKQRKSSKKISEQIGELKRNAAI